MNALIVYMMLSKVGPTLPPVFVPICIPGGPKCGPYPPPRHVHFAPPQADRIGGIHK